jgi:hypothetical protein
MSSGEATVFDSHGEPAQPAPADGLAAGARRCSRCREEFPADPTLLFPQDNAWWLCPPCQQILLGAKRSSGRRASEAPEASTTTDVTP